VLFELCTVAPTYVFEHSNRVKFSTRVGVISGLECSFGIPYILVHGATENFKKHGKAEHEYCEVMLLTAISTNRLLSTQTTAQ